MEDQNLSREQMDSYCRALSAVVEMVEGPVEVSLKFPLIVDDSMRAVELQSFRCAECDEIHVQLEIYTPPLTFDWNKEKSDALWFGSKEEEE